MAYPKATYPPKKKAKYQYKKYDTMVKSNAKTSNVKGRSVASFARTLRPSYFNSHISAMPSRLTETLRYSFQSAAISITHATYTEPAVINMNSTYDPEYAIGGGQPLGFTKLMAIYTKCYVRAARIKFEVALNLGDEAATLIGVSLSTNGTSLGSANQAINQGMETHKLLFHHPDTKSLQITVDVGKFMSVDDIMDGDQFFCTNAANPQQLVCAHFWAQNQSLTVDSEIFYTYTVDYDCVFTDPQNFT